MLDMFASVGATGFNVTWTNLQDQPRRSHKGMSIAEITRAMPRMLDAAIADTLNLIVRPLAATCGLSSSTTSRPSSCTSSPPAYQFWKYLRANKLLKIGSAVGAGDHLGDALGDLDQAEADRIELGIAPERGLWSQSAQAQHQPVRRRCGSTGGTGWPSPWCTRCGRRRGAACAP